VILLPRAVRVYFAIQPTNLRHYAEPSVTRSCYVARPVAVKRAARCTVIGSRWVA
jgi:hypothetical protein